MPLTLRLEKRAGNAWQAYYSVDSLDAQVLEYLVYNRDRINLTVLKCTKPYGAWRVTKPVEHTRKFADVSITSSLWNDMTAAGASPMLLVHLEDIYAWTVDFFGLQKGDRFRVIYTEASCEGEVIDIDTIHIAMFNRGDKEMPAIRFDQGDGGNLYWNEKGESMRKAFLKAPLRFSRISSGFSYHRKHPVSGVVTIAESRIVDSIVRQVGIIYRYIIPTALPALLTEHGSNMMLSERLAPCQIVL